MERLSMNLAVAPQLSRSRMLAPAALVSAVLSSGSALTAAPGEWRLELSTYTEYVPSDPLDPSVMTWDQADSFVHKRPASTDGAPQPEIWGSHAEASDVANFNDAAVTITPFFTFWEMYRWIPSLGQPVGEIEEYCHLTSEGVIDLREGDCGGEIDAFSEYTSTLVGQGECRLDIQRTRFTSTSAPVSLSVPVLGGPAVSISRASRNGRYRETPPPVNITKTGCAVVYFRQLRAQFSVGAWADGCIYPWGVEEAESLAACDGTASFGFSGQPCPQ
jgi:hypothetical protein